MALVLFLVIASDTSCLLPLFDGLFADLRSSSRSTEIAAACLHPQSGYSTCLAFDDISGAIISGSDKGEISVYDVRMQRLRAVIPHAHKKAVRAFGLSTNSRLLASGSAHGDVKVCVALEMSASRLRYAVVRCCFVQVWSLPELEASTVAKNLHPERVILNNKLADGVVSGYLFCLLCCCCYG